MRNIVIIGDSLACPRPWIGLGQNDTYASLIQRSLGGDAHVINLASGDRSTRHYASEAFKKTYIENSATDTLVSQLGIVDCAPRLMTLLERGIGFLCQKARVTNAVFQSYVAFKSAHRMFFTRHFPNILVEKDEFERNMRLILENFFSKGEAKRAILINIAFPGAHLTTRSFDVLRIIESYNEVLARIAAEDPERVEVIDIFAITRDQPSLITIGDGHHITNAAHKVIAKILLDCLAS